MHQKKAKDMADACTYADLRFVKSKKKQQNPGSHPTASRTASSEDGELMYENIKSSVVSAERPNSGSAERGAQEKEVNVAQQPWTKHVVYILLMICLILLATCIGLGVRFFQVSEDHDIQSSHFAESIHTKNEILEKKENKTKETQLELNQMKTELEHIRGEMNIYNDSLHSTLKKLDRYKLDLEETQNKLREAEEKSTEAEKKLIATEKTLDSIKTLIGESEKEDCCPKGWILRSGSCLFFSTVKAQWFDSKRDCESKNAQLINRSQPSEIQAFVNRYEDFWVGLRKKNYGTWINYQLIEETLSDYDLCGYISNGNVYSNRCNVYKKWICEKRSSMIQIKEILSSVA